MFKQYRRYRNMVMVLDVTLTLAAFATVVQLRPFLPGRPIAAETVLPDSLLYVALALLWHAVFASGGLYREDRLPNFWQQLGKFCPSFLLVSFALFGVLYLMFRETSRLLILYFLIVDSLVLVFIRWYLARYLKEAFPPTGAASVLIAGISATGVALAHSLTDRDNAAFRVIGFVDDRSPEALPVPVPVLGSLRDIRKVIGEHDVSHVVLAFPNDRHHEMSAIITMLDGIPLEVYVVPDLSSLAVLYSEVEKIGDVLLISIRERRIRGSNRVMKRIMDLILATLMLVITWPVLVVLWIAVKLDSPGPALYVAERMGENGKRFRMYKFRTMVMDAETLQWRTPATDQHGRHIYKTKDDPRVTRVGKWLRKTSLDELPQLFNILKGEMSLVGPRPEQPLVTDDYDHWQWQRLAVPPGLTGWWQVSGRSDLPMHLNTQYDLHYVRNYSLWLDLKILAKTIPVVIRGKGAY